MSIRQIRIYKGKPEFSNLIGFSAGATSAPDHPRFAEFMAKRMYEWDQIDARPDGSVSLRHVEVRPPLSQAHLQELGALCVGGPLDGEYLEGIINPYRERVVVLDNRLVLPDSRLGGGETIALS